jgi:uncharacterized protein (DUF2141 family)
MILPYVMAQQETAWVWSVKTGDIQQLNNKSFIPPFYMPNDSVNISWSIEPASKTDVKKAQLWIYSTGSDISNIRPLIQIAPMGQKYIGSEYISLDTVKVSPGKTYNIEIMANANTDSKPVNETHIIEIKIKAPGTLVLRKNVPGWKNADLSGWNFVIEGPLDFPKTNQIYSSITTDSTGVATLAGLRPGDYTITEEPKNGWKNIGPKTETVPTGTKVVTIDNTPNTLTITKADSERQPLSNWVFKLIGTEGQGTFTTPPTDSSGVTVIKGLPSGEYDIQEDPAKVGWRRISILPGLPIKFESGENKSVVITNAKEGSISITKKDSEGTPLAGWSFSIAGPDRKNVITDSSGVATTGGLLPGEYTVLETMQQGWQPVTDPEQKLTLLPGEHKQLAFINATLIPLNIIKFNDKNGNGRLDRDASGSSLESGLSGWTFTVEGPKGFKTVVGPTNVDGVAVARDLTPGEYKVTEEISSSSKPGWICTTANPQMVKLSRNVANTVVFGNKVNRLTLVSFNDLSMNGKRESNESGLSGRTFVLKGPNDISNSTEITTAPTGVEGVVEVEGLKPGTYIVAENLVGGWVNTTPTSISATISAGEEKQVEFGNIKPGRIEIFKFNDTNRNGRLDVGESGVPGWSFKVEGPGGFVENTNPTDSGGITALKGLLPGNYVITEPQMDHWLNTTPRSISVIIGFGDNQRVTFANYYCPRCFRINDQPKTNNSSDQDLIVIKEVSNISADSINSKGYPIYYNIMLCPSRSFEQIAAIPTDIVIAVDNSRSLSNIGEAAISGVQALVDGISKNDTQKVTRLGLVSWSDKDFSKTQVPLTSDYNSVASAAKNIIFPEGNNTDYQEAINSALLAFQGKESNVNRTKKIVFITDANDSGYIAPSSLPGRDYMIYAIVVGNNQGIKSYETLDKLTRDHQGYIRSINNISELQNALIKMATAGSKIKNVRLVETLPNYLILNNGTAEDDSGKIQLNGDSKEWTTTTISWDVGDLSGCWNTTFEAFFCWKLPADVNQPRLASYVNYTDDRGVTKSITLPEYEINIVPSAEQKPQSAPIKAPGFESLFTWVGMMGAIYLSRRLNS